MISFRSSGPLAAGAAEGVDQPLDVLVRLDVADIEHERVIELVALPHEIHPLGIGRRQEALVDRVVRSPRPSPARTSKKRRMSRFEASETVRMRSALRVALHIEPLRVDVREPARQVLREHQVDAVVNGHDRPAPDERRQHVVRLVHQSHALARQRQRNAELLGDRIRPAPSPAPSGNSGRARRPSSTSSGRHSTTYSVVAIEPRQLDQDVADVGADAEVAKLARVDGDSHPVSSALPVTFR